jgi:hypothetical protein
VAPIGHAVLLFTGFIPSAHIIMQGFLKGIVTVFIAVHRPGPADPRHSDIIMGGPPIHIKLISCIH